MVPTTCRRLGLSLGLGLGLGLAALTPAVAIAAPLDEVSEDHPGHHHAEYPNLIGVRAGLLSIFATPEAELEYRPAFFVGLSYERTLIHNWLELEISVPVALIFEAQTKVALPIDLHFKKPFHPSPRVSPYIALGPAFDFEVHPDARVFFGGSVAVGTYVWPSRRVGVDIEVDYNIVAEEGRPVHELLFAVGPVFRL